MTTSPLSGAALVALARQIATEAHADQRDKTGHPYLDNPARVAARVVAAGGDDRATAAAWLHDVLEDTGTTAPDLRARGIPSDVVAAVEALSRRPGEAPELYFARINADPLAVQVKHADLADNTDPTRTAELDPATAARLSAKYRLWAQLLAPLSGSSGEAPVA